MREHPILFSAPMIRALLTDRKHVTRRLDKRWLKVKAGDRLWVRETWAPRIKGGEDDPNQRYVKYRADGNPNRSPCDELDWHQWPARWRPSIHMPRWASRILLECEEDARLERLQDITEEDAIAEGIEVFDFPVPPDPPGQVQRMYGTIAYFPQTEPTAVTAFRRLWSTLHTKPGERWEDNPEVVRVGRFHRVEVANG